MIATPLISDAGSLNIRAYEVAPGLSIRALLDPARSGLQPFTLSQGVLRNRGSNGVPNNVGGRSVAWLAGPALGA